MAGTKAVKPGAMSCEVDDRVRKTLIEAGCEVSPFAASHGIGVGTPEILWITPLKKKFETINCLTH